MLSQICTFIFAFCTYLHPGTIYVISPRKAQSLGSGAGEWIAMHLHVVNVNLLLFRTITTRKCSHSGPCGVLIIRRSKRKLDLHALFNTLFYPLTSAHHAHPIYSTFSQMQKPYSFNHIHTRGLHGYSPKPKSRK